VSSTGSYFSDAYIEKVSDKEYRDTYAADQLRLRLAMMIRTLRDQRGLTQADLGKIIDKPQSVISRIEDPDYGKVSLQTILDVAAGFDLPVYIDMPEWDDWFRLMQDFSESGLKRDGFDPDQLRAIENIKPKPNSPSPLRANTMEK
jgi:transcriptional regulator with XRE-family HTH domain